MGWKQWPSWLKGGLIALLVWFVIVISVFIISPNRFIDDEWRSCATLLQQSQPNIDPGDVDVSSCGIKKEGFREFLLGMEHLFLKGDLLMYIPPLNFVGIFFADTPILVMALFFGIGALIGWIIGKYKKK